MRWLVALLVAACSTSESPAPAPSAPLTLSEGPAEQGPSRRAPTPAPDEPAKVGVSGQHRAREGSDWTPTEFRAGNAQWKDPGVYVDGKPVGFITFGELPSTLEPSWREVEIDLPFRPGEQPRTEKHRVREYLVADYLEAVGVKLERIDEIQIHGGRDIVAIVTGRELRRVRDRLAFRFLQETAGKVEVNLPNDMKTNTAFDRLRALAVYIEKKPPVLTEDETPSFDGKTAIYDIPYFGEPLRGGVRVYVDDRLAAIVKRNKLGDAGRVAGSAEAGEPRWNLLAFLAAQGVTTDGLTLATLVHGEQPVKTFDGADAVAALEFAASPQKSGEVFAGPERTSAQVILLFSRDHAPRTARRAPGR